MMRDLCENGFTSALAEFTRSALLVFQNAVMLCETEITRSAFSSRATQNYNGVTNRKHATEQVIEPKRELRLLIRQTCAI